MFVTLNFLGVKGEEELENFNVRVFYDKLEDQNLHLASQLAKQQEDLKGFYEKICNQNEELKRLLKDLDPDKLEELERRMAAAGQRERDGLQGAGDTFNTLNANVNLGGKDKYRFAGTLIIYFEKSLFALQEQSFHMNMLFCITSNFLAFCNVIYEEDVFQPCMVIKMNKIVLYFVFCFLKNCSLLLKNVFKLRKSALRTKCQELALSYYE